MIIIILITLLIIFLFIMPIGIRIIHNDNRSDVDLYFYHIFNYRLDLDEFIKLFITEKTNRKKIDPKTILNNIEITIKGKKFIKDTLKKSKVLKSTIVLKQDYDNMLLFFSFWNFCSYYTAFIHNYFQNVKNEYYMVSESKREICFEIIIEVRLIKLLIVCIKDFKEIIKLIKVKRRQKKNGKSYL